MQGVFFRPALKVNFPEKAAAEVGFIAGNLTRNSGD
jgi:hypothetical protein